jgi:hypothetical protein
VADKALDESGSEGGMNSVTMCLLDDAVRTPGIGTGVCAAETPITRRLVARNEVEVYLSLATDKVQFLLDTEQLTAIRIRGEERFDVRELDRLVETYKTTAQRRAK